MLGDAMAKAYADGAEPTRLIVPYNIKRSLVHFKGRESTQVLVGKTEVVATVDVIATDGGRVTAMPSRWLPVDLGLLLDPEYARLAFFRNFRQYPIAKIGDAETRMIVVEWGTQVDSGVCPHRLQRHHGDDGAGADVDAGVRREPCCRRVKCLRGAAADQ